MLTFTIAVPLKHTSNKFVNSLPVGFALFPTGYFTKGCRKHIMIERHASQIVCENSITGRSNKYL